MRFGLLLIFALLGAPAAQAAEVLRVAVASNFRVVLAELQPLFEASYPAQLSISAGSTGQLFAQIVNGAPHDVFLAADAASPARLGADGRAVPDSAFTYALGRLALMAPGREIPEDGEIPDLFDLDRISIANPRTAPYGKAAMVMLDRLDIAGLDLAVAQNAAGVVAAVRSGAAPAGVTALSLVKDDPAVWPVPEDLFDPIRQDAILLSAGADKPIARAFLVWLQGPEARAVIARHGYGLD